MANFEDYVIPGTNILRNKLGITNQDELTKVENEMVIYKLSLLYLKNDYGNFDIEHLCNLHKYLFEDLYEFAGHLRDVTMYRESSAFCDYQKIQESLLSVLNKYIKTDVKIYSQFDLARHLGGFYLDLIDIHPFRDGNGRCVREFLREYVSKRFPDYELDYANIDSKSDKENFRLASIERDMYPMLLAFEFNKALVNVKSNIK